MKITRSYCTQININGAPAKLIAYWQDITGYYEAPDGKIYDGKGILRADFFAQLSNRCRLSCIVKPGDIAGRSVYWPSATN